LISSDVQVSEQHFKDAHFALIYRLEQAIPWLAKFLLPSLLDGFLGQRTNYTDYIRQNGPFFAFPSQRHALAQLWGLPRANTLINYPTSTGKTLIGELLAIEPLLKGQSGVAVYIAPYRAIVSQIVDRDRKRIEAAGITFIRAMGGYMEGLAEIPIADKILLVATPEAFDYVLRVTPQLGERLVAVAIDELHLIEQPGRGTLLECLVGRLRDLQQTQPLHIIGLSAVLSETTNIQQWLDIPDSHILRTTWTPARKRFEIQLPKKRALFYGDPASATQSTESSEIRWEFASGVAKIPFLDDPTRQRQRDAAFNKIADRAAYMAVEMYTKFQGAVLIVCATKRDTRIVARHLLSHLEPEEIRATWVDKLKTVIQQRYPHHQTLLRMLPYRVCYHNADLEYEVRDLLQRLIENHYFKVVVATTTLAEGVDLPFRAVIMHRWTHYAGSGKRSLFSTLLMRNITGRCGRAGMFVEGDTIFFDNPVDDPLYNRPRKELLEAMYIDPPTVRLRSSIQLNDAENGSKVEAQLESAFLALVNQHQPVEQPAERLADVLLCDKTIAGQVQGHLNRVLSAELRRGPTALLTANSPIRLTSYGRAAVQTGLSVRSASEIARLLPELATPYTKPSDKSTIIRQLKLHWNGWFDKIFSLLQGLEELGEREFPVKKDDRILLLWGWYSGWSAPAIVWLTYYRKENVNIPEVEWLRSPSEANPELEDKIAEVQGFCESYFSQGWARILRAVQTFLLVDDSSRTEQTLAEYEQLTPCISRGVYT
ncbi:MAG TPA: DEAD/DEAH box helicase, partial [Sphingobacteriaceae bacterium]